MENLIKRPLIIVFHISVLGS